MLLEIRNVSVSFRQEAVLSHINFYIRGNEKIAVVGRNGAGKSTLLHLIAGTQEPDSLEKTPGAGIFWSRQCRVTMVEQNPVCHPQETVEELAASLLPADSEQGTAACNPFILRFDRYFTHLGFSLQDKNRRLDEFSGGQQTKIMLVAALVRPADVLLLDEPTNHLDLETTQWLEGELTRYPGAVVVVSHDRYLLDQVAQVTWEISAAEMTRYVGNYTAYRQEKTRRFEKQFRAYTAQQQEIEHQKELIEKFKHKPRKAAFARSRQKMLERMDEVPRPVPDDAVIHTGDINPRRPGSRTVLDCDHLLIGYERPIREISIRIRRGQKIGIFGPNGTGKTTFLKTIAGLIPPCHAGTVRQEASMHLGENIDIAYFDQRSAAIESEQNVFDWFHAYFPDMRGEDEHQYLAGFLFRGEDFGKAVSSLSGGEKARLVLAKILAERPNFLLLDEPTNNMDIPAKETLESIFRAFRGTILFVSHDRYFLSHVADSLLLFDRTTLYFPFDYQHWRERQDRIERGEDVSITRQAEDQRLLEQFRAVPVKEKHEQHLSDRQANLEWRFGLNAEEEEIAREAYAKADEALQHFCEDPWVEMQELLPTPGMSMGAEQSDRFQNNITQDQILDLYWQLYDQRQEAAQRSCQAWTRTLLDWYDIYLDK